MSIKTWFSNMWNKFVAAFNSFIKEVFTREVQVLIGEFKDFAIVVIDKLAKTDLTSEAKRMEAFKEIKEEAIRRGKALPDSIINILIEMAVTRLKQQAETVTK